MKDDPYRTPATVQKEKPRKRSIWCRLGFHCWSLIRRGIYDNEYCCRELDCDAYKIG